MSASSPRVVVTGGSGYIGKSLVRALLDLGYDVTNIDRRTPREPAGRFVFADLRQRHQLQPVFEGVQAVLHLGEIPNIHRSIPHEEVYAHNCTIAAVVLQTAAELRVPRFIYTSSCQVYGIWGVQSDATAPIPQKYPIDETQPVCPQNAYAVGKVGAEHYAAALAGEYPDWRVVALRFPWVASDDQEWLAAMARRRPDHVGRVSEMGGYLHVSDAVAGYIAALTHAKPGYSVYHMLANDVRTTGSLRDAIARQHPHWPALPADWPEGVVPVSCEKARRELGWEPKWSLRRKLEEIRATQPS